jgi:hypothetical protein
VVLLVVGVNDVITSGSIPLRNRYSEEDTVCDTIDQLDPIYSKRRLTLRRESWQRRMQLAFESLLDSRRRPGPGRQPLLGLKEGRTYDSVDTEHEEW